MNKDESGLRASSYICTTALISDLSAKTAYPPEVCVSSL